MNISILLGAGFSVAAGYPTAKRLSEMVANTSSHDFYIQAGNLCKRPETLPYQKIELIPFENLLTLIRGYSYAHCNQFDYEQFYDFYWKIWHISDCFAGLKLDKRIKELNGLYQQLVCFYLDEADKRASLYIEQYEHFRDFIQHAALADKVHIHTLNHDTLLERILEGLYSDGFSTDNSLFTCEGGKIPMFSEDNYQGNILLYKLHGSLDRYRYTYQKDISKYEYIKIPSRSGINVESIRNQDDTDTSCLQCLIPDFLTGTTTKIQRYKEPFYQSQFEHFKENLCSADIIYIIGYGGRDDKINEYLLAYAKGKSIYIIDPFSNEDLNRLSQNLGANVQIVQQYAEQYDFR